MKIVIATPLYPPEIGGPATYARLLEQGLPERGVEVEVVKFSNVRHFPKIISHFIFYRRVLRAAERADVVLALDPVSVGFPAMCAAQRARKPFIVKVVGDYAWEQGRQRFGIAASLNEFVKERRVPLAVRFLRSIQERVVSGAKQVIVPSAYLESVVAAWGIPRDKIKVIYNATPLEGSGAVPKVVTNLPRPLVATIGRLVPWKGMDKIIDSIAELREKGGKASLVVVGDGPERAALVMHAEQKLKEEYLFTGTLSHADTLALLGSVDVFVLNSSYEGLSHLLIEALMLGVPAITTDAGGNPEVITHGSNGVLVPVGNASALTEALTKLLSDGDLRTYLSTRAKESSHRFSLENMLAATAHLVQKYESPIHLK